MTETDAEAPTGRAGPGLEPLTRRARRGVRRALQRMSPRFSDHPTWAISILRGPSPLRLETPVEVSPPVLSRDDLPGPWADFVADPFALRVDGRWFLFYEVFDVRRQLGHVEVSVSDDLRRWEHLGRVLREPFHLSYPHVFRADDEIWLLPEAWESGSVRLYRAVDFPTRWEHVADLLHGPALLDPTPFTFAGRWWLFADTDPEAAAGTLRLFTAPELLGPWSEHPASPVVRDDPRHARPAGRVVPVDGRLLRVAQDCSVRYGGAVHARRIDRLDERTYAESPLAEPLLAGSGDGWNATAMHHVDLHHVDDEWVAFVDGHASA